MVSLSSETGDQTIASPPDGGGYSPRGGNGRPLVKAALDVFPDARIEAITELDAPALSPADTDAESDADIGGADT